MPQAGPFLCSSYSIGSFARRVQVRQAVPTQTQAQYEYYRRTGTTESARTFFPHLPENRDTKCAPPICEIGHSSGHVRERRMIKARLDGEREESRNLRRSVERAEKSAATFATHLVSDNAPTPFSQSNVPPGTCCEKMLFSGILFGYLWKCIIFVVSIKARS